MAQSKDNAQSKSEQFQRNEDLDTPTPNQLPQQPSPKREPIKHLLIGSPKAVIATIHYLQVIGYARVSDWSKLQPTENPDEVMSILVRYILMQ